MFREIIKKRIMLEERKPYERDVMADINLINLIDMVYSTMKLDGSCLTKEHVSRIIQGEFIVNATLADHAKVERYKNILREMQNMCEMEYELNFGILQKLFFLLTDCKDMEYRRGNPVLFQWSYNPPHPKDIGEQMSILMNWISRDEGISNDIFKAAQLHNRFVEIYPYDEGTEEMARLVMYYYLLTRGYPTFNLNFSEQEYNDAIIQYLSKGNMQPFYSGLERSIYNKIDVLLQLTAADEV